MADPKRKGLKAGATRNEFTILAKLKPGRGEVIRKQFAELERTPGDRNPQYYGGPWWNRTLAVGSLHEARSVLIDNDTRYVFTTSFDGDWDTYIEDFAAAKLFFDEYYQHLEDWPGISSPAAKDWFQAHQVEALHYFSAYDASVQEVRRALDLQKAFQQVLDDPAAAKALAHPALKPLLNHAAK